MRSSDLCRLVLLAALWGGSFLLYRIVAPALGSVLSAELRVAIAAVALLAWHRIVRSPFDGRQHRRAMAVVGVFNSALPFALFGFAAHALPAAYLAILNATSPLFGALIARVWLDEALDLRRVVGTVAGLLGVAALVGLGPVAVDANTLWAAAACLVAAASYGFAGNYTRRLARPVPPASMATGSQIAAALVMLPLLPFGPKPLPLTGTLVGATLMLGLACTALAYLLYFRLIRDVGATRALTVTFLVPLFAIGWAWLILNEVPTWRMGIGAALVLVATGLIVGRTATSVRPARTSRTTPA